MVVSICIVCFSELLKATNFGKTASHDARLQLCSVENLHNSSHWESVQPISSSLPPSLPKSPDKCQNIREPAERETLRLVSSHVIVVNVKSKPFDIFFPCWKISLFEIGVGQTQYLYYVMHTSYYQNSPRDLELNYLIFELCTLKWTINPRG